MLNVIFASSEEHIHAARLQLLVSTPDESVQAHKKFGIKMEEVDYRQVKKKKKKSESSTNVAFQSSESPGLITLPKKERKEAKRVKAGQGPSRQCDFP